ncbi:DMT family transporter [Jannaschia sp. Os4]|nr:DMT family transporter [Jannaschia sp. Os4]
MVLGMSLIPVGDTAGKLLTGAHGVAPGFVAFARFAVGAAMVALLLRAPVDWRLWRDGRVWLRAALIAAGIGCILTALRTEPIASVFGAFFVGPLVSYALSVLLLGERAQPARAALLGLGFVGTLMVVRPGGEMAPGLLWAVAAGVFYGSFLTASRWLRNAGAPMQLMLTQTAMGTILLAPLAWGAWPPATAEVGGLLLVSGLASATGNILLIFAYRRAAATELAPFVYTQLVAATALGWLVFGTWPDAVGAAGLALLLASGLATLALRRPA